jgi:hypothetical protein
VSQTYYEDFWLVKFSPATLRAASLSSRVTHELQVVGDKEL